MKITTIQAAVGSAVLLLNAQLCTATVQHQHHHLHLEKKHSNSNSNSHSHSHSHGHLQNAYNPKYSHRNSSSLVSRDGKKKCQFPEDKGLFAVTPSEMNGGWALAPDQECVSGTWCPIACPPGKVMAQWKPDTHYTFPESTYGGVYCNDDGEIEVPFKNKAWCVDGTGTVEAVNKAGKVVSFCQTCLPGYEDMIIPTDVYDTATIAVPDMSYWDSTAAHYYINAPGVSSEEGCHWGDESKPIGNWSPYVAGANTDGSGETFVKLGINPVWQDSALFDTKPNFGLRVECPEGGCNGAKCEVDGSGVKSDNKASGAGGSDFCVVTVPKGTKANIVVFNLDGSGGDDSPSSSSPPESSSQPPSTQPASTSSSPTSSSAPPTSSSTSSSSVVTSSSSPPSSSSALPPSTSSSALSSSTLVTSIPTISSFVASSFTTSSSRARSTSSSAYVAGVFHQNPNLNSNSTRSPLSSTPTPTPAPAPAPVSADEGDVSGDSNKNEGAGQRQGNAAFAGLIVAFVAATYLL
ncbi:beta-glucosidase-domain-containing protein [Daldinia bambusicola]|nr:beta-glucosidase-domain-containing protein [Daldinia bambusicola]